MKKHRHIILKLLVFFAVLFLGLGGILEEIALTGPHDGGIKDGEGLLAKDVGHHEKTVSTHSKTIESRNLPGVSLPTGEERKEKTANYVDQMYLKFALLGTVVGDKNYALAIIEDKELRTQKLYKVGHTIHGGVITDILREKVIIRLHGKELIFKMGGGVNSGTEDAEAKLVEKTERVTVSLHEMGEALDTLRRPMSKLHVVPRSPGLEDGKGGLQLLNVEPGSPFDRMGFNDGDVIEAVDGTPVGDPYNAVAMYNLMKSVLPEDVFKESGLDLQSFLNGTDNRTWIVLQKIQKLIRAFKNSKDVRMTLTVRREGRQ